MSIVCKRFLAILSPIILASCAATELNQHTVEIASTVDDVYTRETLNNFSKFFDNYWAIPSQIILQGGIFQQLNSVTPAISVPITSQLAKTAQVVSGASTAITNTRVGTLSGSGLSLGATDAEQVNYNVAPLNDQTALRNQQALYQHAISTSDLTKTYNPPRVFINNKFFYDPFFLREPQCVLCYNNQSVSFVFDPVHPISRAALKVNPRLARGAWIFHDVAPSDEFKDLRHYGNHELFMRKDDFENGVLTNFVLATLAYSNPTETFAAVTVPPPAPAAHALPDGAPAAPQIIVPPVTAPPANNYRMPSSEFPYLSPAILPPLIQ